MAKWNHAVRGSAPDTLAFAATWLGGKAGVNALTFPRTTGYLRGIESSICFRGICLA